MDVLDGPEEPRSAGQLEISAAYANSSADPHEQAATATAPVRSSDMW